MNFFLEIVECYCFGISRYVFYLFRNNVAAPWEEAAPYL